MTKGIGIDIVEVERMAKRIEKPEFVNLVFTEIEIAYCQSKKHDKPLSQRYHKRLGS